MKTLKICFMILAALFAVGLSPANAQAEQLKDLPWSGCIWSVCANGGQGEWICGTVLQHAVFLYNKDGSLKKMHFNYVESQLEGQTSHEVFIWKGAAKIDWISFPDLIAGWNETDILTGDKGTKIVFRTKWHITPDGQFVTDLIFEHCLN